MFRKKLILIFLLTSLIFISLSAVNAAELNDTAVEIENNDDATQNNAILSAEDSDEKIGDSSSEITTQTIRYTFSQTGNYYGETKLHVSITNRTDNGGIEGIPVGIYVDDELWKEFTTDSSGQIDADFKKEPDDYFIEARLHDGTDFTIGSLDVTIKKIPTDFGLSQNSAYYKDTKLTFTLKSLLTGKGLANEKINIKFSNGKTAKITTNSKGVATYDVPFKPGTYRLTATTASEHVYNKVSLKFSIGTTYLKIASNGFSTTYNSGKTLNIKVTNYFNKHAMKNTKISLKIFTGKKSKTIKLTTNSKGIAKYDASKLSIGKHKITIKSAQNYCKGTNQKTVNVKINKAKLNILAPKITTDKNTTKNFKITVKNKETKKAMANVKVTVKVYTGKTYKTYNLKTNKNGQASISTKAMSISTHNIAIAVKGDGKIYPASAKSTITITDCTNNSTIIS